MTNIDNAAPIRILLVDDHAVVREGIRALLEEQPDMRLARLSATTAFSQFKGTTRAD